AMLGGHALGSLVDAGSDRAGAAVEVPAGGLVAAVKSDHLPGVGLMTRDAVLPPPGWSAPPAGQIACILAPVNERDDVKLSTALGRIAADDRALHVSQDPETGGQRVETQGPIHLRWLRETLAGVFGVETVEQPVPPVYRETITRAASVHHRHRKQTGGAGQFADVKLTVEPNGRGAGFVFDEVVKGGAVPRNYIPAVGAGAEDATARGPLGFPVVDVRVTLTDGQHHAVDSSDMAFRIAGRAGVAEALAQGVPVLLQPYHEVRFHVPSVFSGALVPVVSALKGQVLGFDRDPGAKGWDVFRALLPGAALGDLAGQVRSVTQGVGHFDHGFDHYQELYGKEADKISAERAEARAAH
ncbi:MAG: elongation factor G, partial [Thermohalobaculum sp.]|nr:elongation factor G [Thermohalobaculum sp.]